ncbi:MAG: hypothetical protein ISR97_01315 [Nitrospira sp.]|nr:hypothetical protein [Nitrospira sp.]
MQQFINRIRFLHYVSAVLENQAGDPLCTSCNAFGNTVRTMKEELEELKASKPDGLPPEYTKLLEQAETVINSTRIPEKTEGQKKAGNCTMPKGVCFVKSSKALLKEI